MSTFLDNEKPFLLTLPLNELGGRVAVAPLDKRGGCHLAAYLGIGTSTNRSHGEDVQLLAAKNTSGTVDAHSAMILRGPGRKN